MVSLGRQVLLFLTLFAPHVHGDISARLSSESIEELESVRLVIRVHNTRRAESLDLTDLEENFHIMGNNTSSQYKYVNGRTQSWVDYQITLQPRKTGTLAIPPIRVGNLSTNPLALDVRPLTPSTRRQIDELVFYEQQFSSSSVFVQSQISMQRKLFYSNGVQLYGGQPAAPDIPNAKVVTLGENQTTTIQRNGRNYGVVTQSYAIFPEASGNLTIPAVEMTASVRVLNSGRVSRKGVRVATKEKTITVKPIPDAYPKTAPWLPAKNVSISQNFEPTLTEGPVEVGDTLTQVVKITAERNTGASIPPLSSALSGDAFRAYPEAAQLINNARGSDVIGQRIERRNLMPLRPGSLELPSATIVWWDTEANEVRRSTLAATVFQAQGNSINQQRVTSEAPASDAAAPTDGSNSEIEPSIADASNTDVAVPLSQLLQWSVVVIAILLGIVIAARGLNAALKTRTWILRQSRKRLLQQIAAADAPMIQSSLRHYLQLRYAQPADKAIQAWREEQPEAQKLIRLLDRWCYGAEQIATSREKALALATELLSHNRSSSEKQKKREPLPALYPSN
jgi:hypothetical protein